ncbi:twin-arginine translocation signal domain-containing protein [Halalkalicoccus tibetensis]|uniref:Twin-arginine translocation signal domain-containing protein n=1 Tax=Halalkalicoccus tibetensis TaxID=175632 RepID=A0ABD5VDJ0_9EURY
MDRRQFLRDATAVATGTALGASAGCLELLGLTDRGPTGLGGGPTFQDVHRDEADTVVESASVLVDELNQDQTIWIPDDATIDMSGRSPTIQNATIASGRSEESSGALITTQDRGMTSPAMSDALFTLEGNARVTGVTIRGPHHDYTDSTIVPGYIPLAPGDTYAERQQWRDDWYARAISMQADSSQVDNCEIWGFSTGIMVGSRNTSVSPSILYSYIHNCMMTSSGYPIDVKRGTPPIYRCAFDAYRHALNGYGTADAGYIAVECDFGPHTASHILDMHGIHNNEDGSGSPDDLRYQWRAGGTMITRRCRIMPTNVIDETHHNHGPGYVNHNEGGHTPHVHVRGVPADGFYFENNICAHPSPDEAIDQSSVPGSYDTNENGWHNVYTEGNQWGVELSGEAQAEN